MIRNELDRLLLQYVADLCWPHMGVNKTAKMELHKVENSCEETPPKSYAMLKEEEICLD